MRQTVGRNLGYTITTDQHGSQDIPEPVGLVGVESVISDVIVFDAGSERETHAPHGGSFGGLDSELRASSNTIKVAELDNFPQTESKKVKKSDARGKSFPFLTFFFSFSRRMRSRARVWSRNPGIRVCRV